MMAIQQWWRHFRLEQNDRLTDRQTRHLFGSILFTSTFIFISLTDTQCTDEMNRSTNAGMLMNAEVSGGGEREKSEGESREAQFTHMVLVSGVPLKDNVVWNKLYISQFEGIFKTLMPATERSLSAISYMDNTHCAAEINVRERQWKTGMVTEWRSTGV